MFMLKKNYREDFVHVVKFIGKIMSTLQISRGIMSTYTNLSRGDLSGEGILSYTVLFRDLGSNDKILSGS